MAKNLEKEFVTYEQALALQELGFDEECFATWNGETLDMSLQIPSDDYFTQAPLKQQVFRWFRKKYDLHSYIFSWSKREIGWGYDIPNDLSTVRQTNDNTFNTYEEAENACIDKLFELTKQDKNARAI